MKNELAVVNQSVFDPSQKSKTVSLYIVHTYKTAKRIKEAGKRKRKKPDSRLKKENRKKELFFLYTTTGLRVLGSFRGQPSRMEGDTHI